MNMDEKQIAEECERQFQNGGPKVYVYNPKCGSLQPSVTNKKGALWSADDGEQVWWRGKDGRVYRWKVAHKVIA